MIMIFEFPIFRWRASDVRAASLYHLAPRFDKIMKVGRLLLSPRAGRQAIFDNLLGSQFAPWTGASGQTEVAKPLKLEATHVVRSPLRRTDR
jgi:hypothetical protein